MAFAYRVLYTQVTEQDKLIGVLKRYFPKEHGTLMLPRVEIWRRDMRDIAEQRLFPGYVFLYTDYSLVDLHTFLKRYAREASLRIKELGFLRREGDIELSDVQPMEVEFLDHIRSYDGIFKMSL